MPIHLGIIPDGNRRWAKERGKDIFEGHKEGANKLIQLVNWCKDINEIDEISIYLLSTENIRKRSECELKGLMSLIDSHVIQMIKEYSRYYDINVYYSQEDLFARESLKNLVVKMMNNLLKIIHETRNPHAKKKLNLLLAYGSRKEITQAARKFNGCSEEEFKKQLWVKRDLDIIIRTGKEHRISNFLLFQCAYAEIFFLDIYWPEITKEHFLKVLEEFKKRERRFGK